MKRIVVEKIMALTTGSLSLIAGVSLFFAQPVNMIITDTNKSFRRQRNLPPLQKGTFRYGFNKILYVIMGLVLLGVGVSMILTFF
ncbi:MAG: hypothetical protein JSW40_01170 [Candidatus Omnitrophota bacterium]|nr:MAG: hypothetical protein JSW40_01170 [Candidatus Omnitrophota bacterium]